MRITCIPTKQIYLDADKEFRIISCQPIDPPEGFMLSKYGNFTLAGSNLLFLALNKKIELEVEPDTSSKYPASYTLVGVGGIDISKDGVFVDPSKEYSYLCQIMEDSQAKRVHDAYPNFVALVLNGQEKEIDFKKIRNVGNYRLKDYIDKIKANYKSIAFSPVLDKWGCNETSAIKKIMALCNTPEEAALLIESAPYKLITYLTDHSFPRIDRVVLRNKPEMIDTEERCLYGLMHILKQNEEEGDTRLNANILARMARDLIPECMDKIVGVVKKDEKAIYYDEATKDAALYKTYNDECNIAWNIYKRRLADFQEPVEDVHYEQYRDIGGTRCTDEQLDLLKVAVENHVGILVGPAGSGKSLSTKALITMLDDLGKSYLLLAPTGVAAKRLREATDRQAYTIAMFLVREDLHRKYDYVIVDEMSMVGVHSLAELFTKIGLEPRVVFICDNAQLVSISCGNIVQDILDSGRVPVVQLTKIFRYNTSGLITVATDTRMGSYGREKLYPDYEFLPSNHSLSQVIDSYASLLAKGYKKEEILILCPFNKGAIGSMTINQAIQEKFNPNEYTEAHITVNKQTVGFKIGDKVINIKNNYGADCVEWTIEEDEETGEKFEGYVGCGTAAVMNGDLGIVRDCINIDDQISLIIEFDCGLIRYTGSELSRLLLGYCISIHRSQGSQAKAVIVVVDKLHTNMLTRNLVYVADTRAQEYLIEIADEDALKMGLNKESNKERETWLKGLLEHLMPTGDDDEED